MPVSSCFPHRPRLPHHVSGLPLPRRDTHVIIPQQQTRGSGRPQPNPALVHGLVIPGSSWWGGRRCRLQKGQAPSWAPGLHLWSLLGEKLRSTFFSYLRHSFDYFGCPLVTLSCDIFPLTRPSQHGAPPCFPRRPSSHLIDLNTWDQLHGW